jgi:muramoyltetrapeptide carboxypeptidase LdcA involved in peptidoglycan recycling
MHPIIPRALKRGDTVAFISPSARLNDILPGPLERGRAYVESLGFEVRIFYTALAADAVIDKSIRTRCEELHAAFRDSAITAIICTIGGDHANEMLPFLDYSLIQSHPKIFVGYSDTTFLHYAINSRTGLRTFYGPSILTDISDFPTPMQFTVDHCLHVLTKAEDPVGPLPRSPIYSMEHNDFLFGEEASEKPREVAASPSWRWLRSGRATGQLYGGTVSCLVRLQGTNYAPGSWKGKILFLESSMGDDISLPYSVTDFRSSLVDLALSGALHDISGMAIGRGYKYDRQMQDEIAGVIGEIFNAIVAREPEGLPIVMNVDFGHTSPLLTLPIGALARMDSHTDEFMILEPGVQA